MSDLLIQKLNNQNAKTNSQRIKCLKDNLFKTKRQISIERAVLYTESYKTTEGKPVLIRRAMATAHIMENVKISIREQELLAGNRTIRPRSGIISPEMDPYWTYQEMDTIDTRPQDQFEFTKEDKKVFVEELYAYWQKKSMKDFITDQIDEDINNALDQNVIKLNQTDKGQGHIIVDFPAILSKGIQNYIEELDKQKKTHPENLFYQASSIVFSAMQQHILRYAELAQKLSEEVVDEQRKVELVELTRVLIKISTQAPESFYEALQLLWMTCLVCQYECNASSLSLGRMDQYFISLLSKVT